MRLRTWSRCRSSENQLGNLEKIGPLTEHSGPDKVLSPLSIHVIRLEHDLHGVFTVGVAQLVRALDCGSRCRRFEPGHPPSSRLCPLTTIVAGGPRKGGQESIAPTALRVLCTIDSWPPFRSWDLRDKA